MIVHEGPALITGLSCSAAASDAVFVGLKDDSGTAVYDTMLFTIADDSLTGWDTRVQYSAVFFGHRPRTILPIRFPGKKRCYLGQAVFNLPGFCPFQSQ